MSEIQKKRDLQCQSQPTASPPSCCCLILALYTHTLYAKNYITVWLVYWAVSGIVRVYESTTRLNEMLILLLWENLVFLSVDRQFEIVFPSFFWLPAPSPPKLDVYCHNIAIVVLLHLKVKTEREKEKESRA